MSSRVQNIINICIALVLNTPALGMLLSSDPHHEYTSSVGLAITDTIIIFIAEVVSNNICHVLVNCNNISCTLLTFT